MGGDTHDLDYYLKCMTGGLLACGLTHTFIVPLDVMKCKKQIDSSFSTGFFNGLSKLKTNGQLTLGWAPTLVGYSAQGLGKFGFYEIFKDVYKGVVGEENADKYKKIGWSIASGSAEVIADLLLCPWEATKLKIQLSRPGNESPLTLVPALRKITAEEGTVKFTKVSVVFTRESLHYGVVKFLTQS
jgi:solute carrier family 25 phosphate transporter 3